MFNSLTGTLSGSGSDCIYLQCGGIEWELTASARDIAALLNTKEHDAVRVWTHLVHRENEMKLFGFSSEQRRATFLDLQKVEGIGPKAAIKILGGISQEDLEQALESGDLARLESIPGLGKKTAQKMILALKGKIVHTAGTTKESSPYSELASALCEMGYDRKAALDALSKAATEIEGGSSSAKADEHQSNKEKENAVFRRAIVLLSGA
ncbi:MAG: Holliday junction branch migration protein RuvA [Termitinemataceae bacterium]|nr:MAG: Holliday junction branch migration protein RuvA [Termitinemataceae bacterium]